MAQVRSLSLNRLWQTLSAVPLPTPENSIPLRVLVQLAVAIGILSIDVAMADVSDPQWISLWAVPVSGIGAYWSYLQRAKRNVPVKFCIAIAMMGSLGLFFLRLVTQANDTRTALAQLLIELQVFHSFDMPRRKDLGYSLVIGLILLGVSATLSQTSLFAVLLLLFLIVAIPALILDYRSRLGLTSATLKRASLDLAPRRLVTMILLTLTLGMTIFALLPRLPGYQIRTFPVSTPIEFEGQFDSTQIVNPGYVREGRGLEGNAVGMGGQVESGPGELSGDFYYGFNARMNQNLRGQMTAKVVMRVRSQAAGFWRVMAFDRYTGQGWEVSRNLEEQMEKLQRPVWSFRFNVPWSVTLNATREVIQSYTIVDDLPNVIPSLYEPKELYFPTREVAIDAEGALRSPVPLSEGLTYTVVSAVPYRDRSLLRTSSDEYPFVIQRAYLNVPATIRDRVRQRAEAILATSPNPLTSAYEKTLYLAQYLKQNYRVQPDMPFLAEGEDLVEAFLFKYEGGYPDHFATTLTILLRSLGIPARLAVGFNPGEFNPFTGYYVVRNTDAFALTEVFFPKYGWFTFNPIPGMNLIPASVEESQTFSILRRLWEWVAGWLPSPIAGGLNWLFEQITSGLAWGIALLSRLFTQGWMGLLLGLASATAIAFLGWLGFSGWQSWRYHRLLAQLPPMEALYRQMVDWLTEKGSPKTATETPLEYARRAYDRHPAHHAQTIDEISHAYVRWRYGGEPVNLSYLQQRFQEMKSRSDRARFASLGRGTDRPT